MEDHSKKHPIPPGTRCELCGMLAATAVKDAQGVVHFYCEHHVPSHSGTQQPSHLATQQPAVDRHADHSVNMFRDRFFISLALTIPVVIYSDLFRLVFGFSAPAFPYSDWIAPLFSTAIFFYGGMGFLKSARGELKARLPGMMTLIALAISVAFLYSLATLFFPLGEPLFWEMSTLITIMLLGHWIEMRAASSASAAPKELAKL